MLGQERVRAGLIRRREHRRIVAEALELLEHPDIRPEARVGDLGVGAQQLVEVARALVSSARVIVFDEPTSSLSERDAERLFAIIDRLRRPRAGHHLHQPFPRGSPAGRPDLHGAARRPGGRRGRLADTDLQIDHRATWSAATWTSCFPHVPHAPGEPILELDELRVPEDGAARRAWCSGAARSWASPGWSARAGPTLLRAIFGLEPVVSGRIRVAARSTAATRRPSARIAQGVGFLSEDRKSEGLALARSIEDNLTYSALRRHARWGWLRLKERRAEVARWMARLRIEATGPGQTVGEPLRRQSAEGGPGAAAPPAGRRPAPGRADARHRRRLQGRDLSPDRRAGRRRARRSWSSARTFPSCSGSATGSPSCRAGTLSEARPVVEWTEHEVMEVATRERRGSSEPASDRTERATIASLSHRRGRPTWPASSSETAERPASRSAARSAGSGRSSARSWGWS